MPGLLPWYGVVEDDSLEQGDFFPGCPFAFPEEIPDISEGEEVAVQAPVRRYDVVLMSQSCDLFQGKLENVLFCPYFALPVFEAADKSGLLRSDKGKETLRRGNMIGYHMLAACDQEGFINPIIVVSFKQVLTRPLDQVIALGKRPGKRLRLLPPYREQLAQAFGRFLMRVGLPEDIPPFAASEELERR